MQILIDGDACPVKSEVYQIASESKLEVLLITSVSHFSQKELPAHVTVVYVDEGADSADYRVVALAKKGDIIITQDYGLASLVLGKGAYVLHHLGTEYTKATIGLLLESRHHHAKIRKSGGRTKGPKKFTEENRVAFSQALLKMIQEKKPTI